MIGMKRTRTTDVQEDQEAYRGLGRNKRREMIRRWKAEGQPRGLTLKAWARETEVGDAAFVWLETKKAM